MIAPLWLYGGLAALALSAGLSGWGGYTIASNACAAEKVEALQAWQAHAEKLEAKYREKEQLLLDQAAVRKAAIYDLATRLPDYTPDDCRLTDDGLQDIRETVRRIDPRAQ